MILTKKCIKLTQIVLGHFMSTDHAREITRWDRVNKILFKNNVPTQYFLSLIHTSKSNFNIKNNIKEKSHEPSVYKASWLFIV